MELFFDLVYVFAFTQLSEHLYEHRNLVGGLQTAVLFLALWWAWDHTAWATGLIDPERPPVVALLAVLMAISLVLSATITTAFEERGSGFAIAYVALQVLRIGFMIWAFGPATRMGRNYRQMLVWALIAGVAWIAGGLVHGADTRLAIWAGAVALDYGVPLLGFRLPRVAPIPVEEWTIASAHLAERCEQVLMVAFGETMLRIGEAYAVHRGTVTVDAALVVGFILIIALWSIYFLHHAVTSPAAPIARSGRDAARVGQSVYTYAHAVMVGAVIVVADAIHLAVEAPGLTPTVGFSIICLGGPAMYLLGIAMSKLWLGHGRGWPPLVGAAALLILGIPAAFGTRLTELIAAMIVASVLSLVAARDSRPAPAVPV